MLSFCIAGCWAGLPHVGGEPIAPTAMNFTHNATIQATVLNVEQAYYSYIAARHAPMNSAWTYSPMRAS
jgi:hypothetical protein